MIILRFFRGPFHTFLSANDLSKIHSSYKNCHIADTFDFQLNVACKYVFLKRSILNKFWGNNYKNKLHFSQQLFFSKPQDFDHRISFRVCGLLLLLNIFWNNVWVLYITFIRNCNFWRPDNKNQCCCCNLTHPWTLFSVTHARNQTK